MKLSLSHSRLLLRRQNITIWILVCNCKIFSFWNAIVNIVFQCQLLLQGGKIGWLISCLNLWFGGYKALNVRFWIFYFLDLRQNLLLFLLFLRLLRALKRRRLFQSVHHIYGRAISLGGYERIDIYRQNNLVYVRLLWNIFRLGRMTEFCRFIVDLGLIGVHVEVWNLIRLVWLNSLNISFIFLFILHFELSWNDFANF